MHLGAIASAAFFSVEMLTFTGLVRYVVLCAIAPAAVDAALAVHRQTCLASMDLPETADA